MQGELKITGKKWIFGMIKRLTNLLKSYPEIAS
jgi:hypothetical protein